LGYAVPMPVVVRTRPFDQDFYKAVADLDWVGDLHSASPEIKAEVSQRAEIANKELFG